MSAALPSTVAPPLTGWRCWRIMPFERLGERSSVRLCASGTRGIPKVWAPRVPASAVCGKFKTTHEAPWPGCECGLYAYREREAAEATFGSFTDSTSGEGSVGWAFGRVSLWGRIVESELGWRAEFAYPYELTVYAEPEVACEVRGLYGIDVEQRSPIEPPEPEPPEVDRSEILGEVVVRLEEIQAGLAAIGNGLSRVETSTSARRAQETREAAWREFVATLPPLPAQLDASPDGLLLAVFAAVVAKDHRYYRLSRPQRERVKRTTAEAVCSSEILDALLALRRIPGLPSGWGSYSRRDGYRSLLRQTSIQVVALAEDGLVVGGLPEWYSNPTRRWRITEAGRARLRAGGIPARLTLYREVPLDAPPGFETVIVPTRDGWRSLSLPPRPFLHELEAAASGWRRERQAAARKSRAALTAWCDRQRALAVQLKTPPAKLLALTDEEVAEALRRASRKGPAEFGTVADLLTPGNRTQSETAVIAQALSRLHRGGRAGREDTPDGRVWTSPVSDPTKGGDDGRG